MIDLERKSPKWSVPVRNFSTHLQWQAIVAGNIDPKQAGIRIPIYNFSTKRKNHRCFIVCLLNFNYFLKHLWVSKIRRPHQNKWLNRIKIICETLSEKCGRRKIPNLTYFEYVGLFIWFSWAAKACSLRGLKSVISAETVGFSPFSSFSEISSPSLELFWEMTSNSSGSF